MLAVVAQIPFRYASAIAFGAFYGALLALGYAAGAGVLAFGYHLHLFARRYTATAFCTAGATTEAVSAAKIVERFAQSALASVVGTTVVRAQSTIAPAQGQQSDGCAQTAEFCSAIGQL